jgi:hypothetical protein
MVFAKGPDCFEAYGGIGTEKAIPKYRRIAGFY